MRKTLIAALTALTALALAAVAIAQTPPVHRRDGDDQPVEGRHEEEAEVGEGQPRRSTTASESKTSASKIEISFPKTLKLSTKGLKTCSVAKLDARARPPARGAPRPASAPPMRC